MEKTINMRIEHLRACMQARKLDALIIRDTRDLRWATGFDNVFDSEEAHTAIVTRDALIIHTDSRYSSAMRAASAKTGDTWIIDEAAEQAAAFVGRAIGEYGLDSASIGIDSSISLALFRSFEAALGKAKIIEIESMPLSLRAKKDPCEVEKLKRAQRIAENAFLEVLDGLHAGMSEREIATALDFSMRAHGADGNSFASIIASGPNGANPHAIPTDRQLQHGDLIVFDFGVELAGYCSDTTRVVSVGKPSAEQQKAYQAVRLANETVEQRIRPGVTGKEMHELALEVLEQEGYGGLMGHGLGHGVGLAIHELPNLNPRNDKPLEEGNVVTVEPGIYLEGKFGIRLEDCGAITPNGFDSFCTLSHELMQIG